MNYVEKTGLFTCLREKTWKEFTEGEIERMAVEFVETVRRGCDEREDYGVAMRFLNDVGKRLSFWRECQEESGREDRVFFRRSTRCASW